MAYIKDGAADCLKRSPGKRVSQVLPNHMTARSKAGPGRYGDIGKGGPSGGTMGSGKRNKK